MIDQSRWPEGLRIRHVEPADFEGFHGSMATPLAMRGTLQMPYSPREGWRERLSKYDSNAVVLVAEVPSPRTSGAFEIIGNAGMFPFGPTIRRRHAMHIGMAVRDDWQRRGVGGALMSVLVDRADNWMNVLRLELTVYVDNAGAIALYRRFGFETEGLLRAYAMRDGEFVDAYAMARLHPKQPRLPDPPA